MVFLLKLYSADDLESNTEYCYYIQLSISKENITNETWSVLFDLTSNGGTKIMSMSSILDNQNHDEYITEFGPNLSVITPWASNALSIIKKANVNVINKIERSIRTISKDVIDRYFDKMTQVIYKKPLVSFDPKENDMAVNCQLESFSSTFTIKPDNIATYNKIYGLSMDDDDIKYYVNLFKNELKRNITNVELVMLGQMNSEHSRHHFFRGNYDIYMLKISEQEKQKLLNPHYKNTILIQSFKITDTISLMDKVKTPYLLNPNNSIIAFHDNASCILGYKTVQLNQSWNLIMEQFDTFDNNESDDDVSTIKMITPKYMTNRRMTPMKRYYHPTLTAETHNFPTGIAPFEGAATGVGGRIRDTMAIGQGGIMLASLAGYAVGNLDLDYSWVKTTLPTEIDNSPLDILIGASNGASDYGNKIGEPIIGGYTRSYGDTIKERCVIPLEKIDTDKTTMGRVKVINNHREWFKPVMFSAGIGLVDDNHTEKKSEPGMNILRVGGPAYRIGIGGGAASSRDHSVENKDIDFSAVQRGDPEMESRVVKFINSCIDMGINTPIQSIHDQGAGGMANVTAEIPEPHGATVYMQSVNVGDDTMSDMEIWVSEHQEQMTFLAHQNEVELLKLLAKRENIALDVIGIVTDTSDIIAKSLVDIKEPNEYAELVDYSDDDEATQQIINMVNLPIDKIINDLPIKKYDLVSPYIIWTETNKQWHSDLDPINFGKLLSKVLSHVSVGSKQFLTNKVDRSVGRVSQQQCIGMTQVPLSDFSSVAHNYFGTTEITGSLTFPGIVTAIGEQPIKGLYDVDKMVRLSIAEMLTNMIGAVIEDMSMIRCSANWMWANKSPEDKYSLWKGVGTLRDVLSDLSVAVDGGKDSLSMSIQTKTGDIKAPNALVLTGYVNCPDVRVKVNQGFITRNNKIIYVNLSNRHMRLGGSILSQCCNAMSDVNPEDVPDFETIEKFPTFFQFIQYHIKTGTIKSCHDVSDGGLITALLEMSFPNHMGFNIIRDDPYHNCYETYFHEEPGLIFEVNTSSSKTIIDNLKKMGYYHSYDMGRITDGVVCIKYNNQVLIGGHVTQYKKIWEQTSFKIEEKQSNPICVKSEKTESYVRLDTNVYNIERKMIDRLISLESEVDVLNNILSRKCMTGPFIPKIAIIREEGSNGDREMKAAFATAGFQTYDIHMNDLVQKKITLDHFNGIAFVGGFSYADVFGAAQGWAACIQNHPYIKTQFDNFYNRSDTFSLGVCNGCQLMSLLGWVPYNSRFITNDSGRFESRYSMVTIQNNNSIMLKSMAGLTFGVWSAHGEGKYLSQDIVNSIKHNTFDNYSHSFPVRYVNRQGDITETYPHNPNGSPKGITAIVSDNGRHLAMMPHPERSYLTWQLAHCPEFIKKEIKNFTPWFLMFRNAYNWCQQKIDEDNVNELLEM